MELRSGAMPPEEPRVRSASPAPAEADVPVRPDVPAGPLRWRVPPKLMAARVAGFLLFAAGGIFLATDRTQRVAAAAGAVVAGLYALRDLLAPVRLAADADGLTVVAGFAGRHRLAWSQVERVRVDSRDRLGFRSRMLEIDAGESIHLFSEYDLGAPIEDVAEQLARIPKV